jgi:hypothetical protein
MTQTRRVQIKLPSDRNMLEASFPGDLFHNKTTDELYVIRHLNENKLEFRVFDRESLVEQPVVELSGKSNILEVLHSLTPVCGLESFDVKCFLIAGLNDNIHRMHNEIRGVLEVIKTAKSIVELDDDAPTVEFFGTLTQLVQNQK